MLSQTGKPFLWAMVSGALQGRNLQLFNHKDWIGPFGREGTMISRLAAITVALAVSTGIAAGAMEKTPANITAAVADSARPAADRARDANRKPAESLAFAGVKLDDR